MTNNPLMDLKIEKFSQMMRYTEQKKSDLIRILGVTLILILTGCGGASSPIEIVKQTQSFSDTRSRTYERLVENYKYFSPYNNKNWAVDTAERHIRPEDIPNGLESIVLSKRVTYNTTLSIQDDKFIAFILGSDDTEIEGMNARIVENRSEIIQIRDYLARSLSLYHGRVFLTDEEQKNLTNLITEIERNANGELSFTNIHVSLQFITTTRKVEGEYATYFIGTKIVSDVTIQGSDTVECTAVPFYIISERYLDIFLSLNITFSGDTNLMNRKKPFDEDGFDIHGFNREGYDRQGFDRQGFNSGGIDREGFDKTGYNSDGFNKTGFNREGVDKDGYGKDGFNEAGFNRNGYGRDGFNEEGFDERGYGRDGYNKQGVDRYGSDKGMNDYYEMLQGQRGAGW